MKIFSNLDLTSVHFTPGRGVIPADEFTKIKSAADLIADTKAQAHQYKAAMIEEIEREKEAAFREGFLEGLEKLNEHFLKLDHALKEIHQETQKKLLPVILAAVRKIVNTELELHPERIADIVLGALKPVTQHRRITIYVNRVDLRELEKRRSDLCKIFNSLENLSLQERDDIEPGGCIIETEAGIINAQLEAQCRALASAFASFRGN